MNVKVSGPTGKRVAHAEVEASGRGMCVVLESDGRPDYDADELAAVATAAARLGSQATECGSVAAIQCVEKAIRAAAGRPDMPRWLFALALAIDDDTLDVTHAGAISAAALCNDTIVNSTMDHVLRADPEAQKNLGFDPRLPRDDLFESHGNVVTRAIGPFEASGSGRLGPDTDRWSVRDVDTVVNTSSEWTSLGEARRLRWIRGFLEQGTVAPEVSGSLILAITIDREARADSSQKR